MNAQEMKALLATGEREVYAKRPEQTDGRILTGVTRFEVLEDGVPYVTRVRHGSSFRTREVTKKDGVRVRTRAGEEYTVIRRSIDSSFAAHVRGVERRQARLKKEQEEAEADEALAQRLGGRRSRGGARGVVLSLAEAQALADRLERAEAPRLRLAELRLLAADVMAAVDPERTNEKLTEFLQAFIEKEGLS
jgi:hypothetical protein